MITIVSEIIKNILGCAEIILGMWGILGFSIRKSVLNQITSSTFILLGPVVSSLLSYSYPIEYSFLVLLNAIAVFLIIDGKIVDKIFKIAFCYFSIDILAEDLNLVINILPISFKNSFIRHLCINVIILFLIVICIKIIRKNQDYYLTIKSLKLILFFVWTIIFILFSAVMAMIEVKENEWNKQTIFFANGTGIALSLLLFASFFLMVDLELRRQQYRKENLIKDEYLKLAKEHYENLEWQIKETRKIKHDIAAHYSALKMLIANKNLEGADNYLSEMSNHFDGILAKNIGTGNELVDAVLSETLRKHPTVNLNFSGTIEDCIMSDYDLCTVFSNLFDNAVEAAENLKDAEKIVKIDVKHYNRIIMIGIVNPIEKQVDVSQLGSYTTKEDSYWHGIGIDNVKKILSSYDANIEFSSDSCTFSVKIQINNI